MLHALAIQSPKGFLRGPSKPFVFIMCVCSLS